MQTVVENYLATWNATGAERTRLLAEHWSPEAGYTDPLAEARGHGDIGAVIEQVQQQFPDFVFSPVGTVDAHHRQMRFQWGLGPRGAEPVVIGFDVLVLDDQDRIADVRGFLDKVPG
ncbi:nuclear transport factor 2 family protein [Sciscionella sediminilitoris]|uniref:nuclear transport factor 2 family protein n=1 Tax=Sciscionella sediminilitoris TaxID=1445613 RepID=UPI0004DEF78A|nr:nuclear transport factor 2 family protein [Sciscionella sp. SE31]